MATERGGRERRRWPRAPLRGKVVGQIYTEQAAPIVDSHFVASIRNA